MSDPSEETEIALLKQEVSFLKDEVAELTAAVKTLTDLWTKASGVLAVMKWLIGLAAAGGALAAFVKYKILGVHP